MLLISVAINIILLFFLMKKRRKSSVGFPPETGRIDFKKEDDKKARQIRRNIRKEFTKTTGDIWHHFGEHCKPNEIIDTHGSWVKTSIQTWQKAFSKASLHDRYGEEYGSGWEPGDDKNRGERSINAARGLSGMYSKDHYEVFFDEKV